MCLCLFNETVLLSTHNIFWLRYKKNIIFSYSLLSGGLVYLRNKLDFWTVHGIMNISGLLQVNVKPFGLKRTHFFTRIPLQNLV